MDRQRHIDAKGIYRITHIESGATYVGRAARSFRARWTNHRSDLRRGVHGNLHLQAAWNKYGEGAFEFAVLESMNGTEEMREHEQFWLDTYHAQGPVYNMGTVADKPTLGYRHTEEARQKMSMARKDTSLSEEHKRNIGNANRGRPNPMRGQERSAETKRRISAALTGRTCSLEHRLANGRARRGKRLPPFTEEHRRRLGEAKAKLYPAFMQRVTGEIIPGGLNLSAMCREHGLSAKSMWRVMHEKRKSHKDWVLYKTVRIG